MKTAALLLCLMGTCVAADVRYTWLPLSTNVLGIPQSATDATQYGVSVLMDTDNPRVSEFRVSIAVKLANGDVRMFRGKALRPAKATTVQYSTIYTTWIDKEPGFEVLAIKVEAVSALGVSRPIAGSDYNDGVLEQH
jgi:hypothetical protein